MAPAQSASAPGDAAAKDLLWQKDVHMMGEATCPACGERRPYGPGGVSNLEKRHLNSGKCLTAAKKRDKLPRPNQSIFGFLKAKVPAIPATVSAPAPVISATSAFHDLSVPLPSKLAHAAPGVTASRSSKAAPKASPRLMDLIRQLRNGCRHLPFNIPEADDTNPLARFSGDPASYVGKDVPSDSLWETLETHFHGAFDYGKGPEEREGMIQTGPQGLGGFLRFMEYFVSERGLEGAVVELKVEQLLEALKLVLNKHKIPFPRTAQAPQDSIVIDVDAESRGASPLLDQETPAATGPLPCPGLVLPPGLDYPFGLHQILTVPWGFEYANGVLTLRSPSCQKIATHPQSSCRSCADLVEESTLGGIMDRAKDGVHENANFAYHGVSGLIQILRRKNQRIQELRLHGLSAASKVITQARSLSDYKRLFKAVGSGVVQRVDRVVGIALKRKRGVRGILRVHDDAARGVYQPKSFTEEEDMRSLLIWKLAGNRVADIVHRSMGLPSRTTLRTRETVPPLVPSPGKPQPSEVAQNVQACFESIAEVIAAKKVVHQVLMYDKIATEKRITKPITSSDLEELFRGLSKTATTEPEVHCAGEATVAALGILSDETRLYAARPVLVSGDCKKETGPEHVRCILDPTIDGVNSQRDLTKLRIVSVASDGESRRGKAFIEKTFVRELSPESDISDLLKDLPHMNFWVGEDDLTPDKDYKHVFKRGRNRLLRKSGTDVMGVEINANIIRVHLQSAGHSTTHINSLFNPDDKQDVKLAFKLLQDIWSLPLPAPNSSPGFRSQRHALRLIGSLFYHLVFPYLCVDLTPSEQLEHLSAAAHIALLLYRDGQKKALPTLLFIDIMIMIKNAYFCVAKAKVDDPTGKFWLILLGTDRLEELFGILRTMIGNDANLDILQLIGRLTGTTQVANILAKYPHWDRAPRRLHLPALTRDSTELSDKTDHIKPPSWRGDVSFENVTPLTCWKRGRRLVEDEFPSLAADFCTLDAASNVDILAPLGTLLVRIDLDPDDNEDDEESAVPVETTSLSTILEDAVVDEEVGRDETASVPAVNHFITVNNKPVNKTRALSLMQKYSHKAASTDRLRRVAAMDRYSSKSEQLDNIAEHDSAFGSPCILVSEPIVTLVRCEEKLFVCVGKVTDIRLDGHSVEQLGVEVLQEQSVVVHFQIVRVVPATAEDDPGLKNDWRARGLERNSLSAPGRLVLPIDPVLSTRIIGEPYYLFESGVLRALGARLLDLVTLNLNKSIPKFAPTDTFPYREALGRACFVCEGDDENQALLETDAHVCPKCTSSMPLDMGHPQTILAHMGAHILHDTNVDRSTQPCGLCLRPWPMCQFFLKRSGSAGNTQTLNMAISRGCPNLVYFSYGTAVVSEESSPCSNAPLRCALCNPKDPAVWRYNFKEYMMQHHSDVSLTKYSHIWELCTAETAGMKKVWVARDKRKKAKKAKPSLVVSSAHSSRLALAVERQSPSVGPDRSLSPESFRNASSVSTPEVSDDEEGTKLIPPSLSEDIQHTPEFPVALLPRVGDFMEVDHDIPPMILDTAAMAEIPLKPSDALPSIAEAIPSETQAPLNVIVHSCSPVARPSSIPLPVMTINPILPVTQPTVSSRSGRKRVAKDVGDLSLCICGDSAVPIDSKSTGDVAYCKIEGCETKWYHLDCLNLESVTDPWVCDACVHSGSARGPKRRRLGGR
ncbi:hypothetical protein B0H17DRAFT_1335340 [Mycena rosella]|uniref:Zinc finger PHD-type domain-containing protein n=1 Tax=Mycena rosella TaxID=1033263 RepID=A0AAD7G6T1_MYCRO|nr:hypothetical protein B0H17DRAFT_1335340 [Mycena rosella]